MNEGGMTLWSGAGEYMQGREVVGLIMNERAKI